MGRGHRGGVRRSSSGGPFQVHWLLFLRLLVFLLLFRGRFKFNNKRRRVSGHRGSKFFLKPFKFLGKNDSGLFKKAVRLFRRPWLLPRPLIPVVPLFRLNSSCFSRRRVGRMSTRLLRLKRRSVIKGRPISPPVMVQRWRPGRLPFVLILLIP